MSIVTYQESHYNLTMSGYWTCMRSMGYRIEGIKDEKPRRVLIIIIIIVALTVCHFKPKPKRRGGGGVLLICSTSMQF